MIAKVMVVAPMVVEAKVVPTAKAPQSRVTPLQGNAANAGTGVAPITTGVAHAPPASTARRRNRGDPGSAALGGPSVATIILKSSTSNCNVVMT